MNVMIDIAITAWPNHPARLDCFCRTVESLSGLTASRHEMRIVCSAESEYDPDHKWCGPQLRYICEDAGIRLGIREGKASLGANMNAALRMCDAPTILLVQDDCPLIHPLDISNAANLLQNNRSVDLIRFEWPQDENRTTLVPFLTDRWRQFNLEKRFYSDRPRLRLVPFPTDRWRQFDLEKRFYGDRPHLRRRDFMERHGWYTEGGYHGQSENDMASQLKRNNAVILAPEKQYFEHIDGPSSVINDTRTPARKR